STRWGRQRALDGHPLPFALHYVAVGNREQLFDAIRAAYPSLEIIATADLKGRTPNLIDEHVYRRSEDEMAAHANDYDSRPRTGPKFMTGEWAAVDGHSGLSMSDAIGYAAWMTGIERNADLVAMSAWRTDLLGFDEFGKHG